MSIPVPFSPDVLEAVLAAQGEPALSVETILSSRTETVAAAQPAVTLIGDAPVHAEELKIPGPSGAPDLELTVLTPADLAPGERLPALYNMHGGGMVVGHRSWETGRLLDLMTRHRVVCLNVEYRLAPEHPYPAGVHDCLAGYLWVREHVEQLGIDPERVVVMGGSAGGGLAAAVSLLARDQGLALPAGQLLLCPMLDNTDSTASWEQYRSIGGTWTGEANRVAWTCVLGEDLSRSESVDSYASPSRAADLSGLPPAFIEVGSAEVFRDEDTAYAARIWAAGGAAELHVWDGGCHGFDIYCPEAPITQAALDTRDSWLRRVLSTTLPA